jgi:hypothetical protein
MSATRKPPDLQAPGRDDPVRDDPVFFGAPAQAWPLARCAKCGAEAQFGYRNTANELEWFCATHRRARWWADARRSRWEVQQNDQPKKESVMDMRKYSGGLIMAEDLHDGPRQEVIVKVTEKVTDRYSVPVLEFESGDQVYLWNARPLSKAWGYESQEWINQTVELSLGHYIDKKTNVEKETIVVKAISPRKETSGNGSGEPVKKPPLRDDAVGAGKWDDMDDDSIPY